MQSYHNKKVTGFPSIDKPWMNFYEPHVSEMQIPNKSMYGMIYDLNSNCLDNIAISYLGNDITYAQLFRDIENIASVLVGNGIGKSDVVLVCSLNTPETVALVYALNYIGAIVDLIPAAETGRELVDEIEQVNAKALFILDIFSGITKDIESNIPIVVLPLGASAKGFTKFLLSLSAKKSKHECFSRYMKRTKQKVAYIDDENLESIILHTSGTTGVPKLAVLTNRNLNAIAVQMSATGKNYRAGETFLDMLPPFISFGIGMLHLSFFSGMKTVILLKPTIAGVAKMFRKYRPTRFVFGPAVIELIERCPNEDLSHIVDLSAGGAPISLEKELEINEILQQKHCNSYYLAGYGMTELSSAVSLNHNEHRKVQSAGLLLPLLNIRIVDINTGEELPFGEEGELTISGPTVMRGYFNNEKATEDIIKCDTDGIRWLHTGDMAKVDEDGFLFITGRIKRIYTALFENDVYKLFPQRLEDLIANFEGIERCGVICVPDEVRQNVPIVFVEKMAGYGENDLKRNLLVHIEKNTPLYYEPKQIVFVDRIPITDSQKIDYKELEKLIVEQE